MNGTLLVLGGRSEIGLALAERLVADSAEALPSAEAPLGGAEALPSAEAPSGGAEARCSAEAPSGGAVTVVLAARRSGELDAERERLLRAGATEVDTVEFDADDLSCHRRVLDEVSARHEPLDTVLVAFGVLGDQRRAETDADHAVAVVHTDYVAQVSVLTHVANLLRAQGRGRIVAFSSVAGVRVRRANYVYGSAKAGLDGFASGLADALAGSGVRLLLVRPGFVVGRMTGGMEPAPFASTPEQVADAAFAALRRGRGEVWVPRVLRPVFAVMRLLPRTVWRRLPR